MPTIQRKGTQNPLAVLLELGQFPPWFTVFSQQAFLLLIPCHKFTHMATIKQIINYLNIFKKTYNKNKYSDQNALM